VRLYLASTSPARLATLRAAGIEPVVVPSEVDEDAAVAAAGPLTTAQMVQLLARLKAEAVTDRLVEGQPIDGFILGGDSAFDLDGVTYGKPHLPEVARERWLLQRGRTGHLHSGHWLIDHRGGVLGGARGAVSSSAVTFADNISEAEIDAYIATGEPLKVAGAFTIDSLGAPFISAIEGDAHAIVGLSLATLRQLLLGFDVSWPSLWNRGAASEGDPFGEARRL
jgi:septum formation protein